MHQVVGSLRIHATAGLRAPSKNLPTGGVCVGRSLLKDRLRESVPVERSVTRIARKRKTARNTSCDLDASPGLACSTLRSGLFLRSLRVLRRPLPRTRALV